MENKYYYNDGMFCIEKTETDITMKLIDAVNKELGKTKCNACNCSVFNMKTHLKTDKHYKNYQWQVEIAKPHDNWGINN